jgi:adenylosuccinate synthase
MTIHAIVGGQFGSEAKGHVAAQLATRLRTNTLGKRLHLVRVGGSNAGHSAAAADGTIWALRQVPAAAVVDLDAALYIAQGSEIDISVLTSEVDALDAAGFNVSSRLYIDANATILEPHHIERESGSDINARTGSTSKGIGAARADRLMRLARTAAMAVGDLSDLGMVCETAGMFQAAHLRQEHVVIEGTQGYGLGLHTRFYPQTTSGDCRTVDLLAQIGYLPLNPRQPREIHTWLVLRTYPIRVAGNSGPMDSDELTWEQLGERTAGYVQPERTTVTKKIRRVAEWNPAVVMEAVQANGGVGDHLHPCLMFVDYFEPNLASETDVSKLLLYPSALRQIRHCEIHIGKQAAMYGTSANTVMFNNTQLAATVRDWSI